MQFIKSKLHQLYLNDSFRRIWHAFWQTFLSVFLAGILGIVSTLLRTHNLSGATSALLALVLAAGAAGFSAVKALYLSKRA